MKQHSRPFSQYKRNFNPETVTEPNVLAGYWSSTIPFKINRSKTPKIKMPCYLSQNNETILSLNQDPHEDLKDEISKEFPKLRKLEEMMKTI